MNASRLALIALTAALLAAALPVTADEGRITAGAVEYGNPAIQGGQLAMLYIAAGELDLGGPSAEQATPWIDLKAATLAAVEYSETHTEASAPGAPFPVVGPEKNHPDVPSEYSQAHAYLTAAQPDFQVQIYSMEGTIRYSAETMAGHFAAGDRAVMSSGYFSTTPDGHQGDPPESATDLFARVDRAGPWIIHYDTAPSFAVTLEGDFVVEMAGISLQVESEGRQGTLESGSWRSPLDPNAPPQSADYAYAKTTKFVRIHLTDAVLELATEGGDPDLMWAATGVATDFSGRAAVMDAFGRLETDAGAVDLRNERHVLPPASRVLLHPQVGEQLTVDVAPQPLAPSGGTLASVPAPASAALIGTGAVLALGIAVGIGVLRRLLRLPALADVERAIEEGEYRKAARLAGRILSRLPGSEEALLGRAIALSKSGRPHEVVAELTRHLALRPASDGTLHYVLGLAQLEAGREAEGKASLREAVRLTPSLHAEVAPRLGMAFSVAQPTLKETNGYA